jgi:hypothetical protein
MEKKKMKREEPWGFRATDCDYTLCGNLHTFKDLPLGNRHGN